MTTIVYRDGVLAADTRAFSGDKTPIGRKSKIRRLKDGTLLGISSATVGEPDIFARTVELEGLDHVFAATMDVFALAITTDGRVYYFNGQRAFTGPLMGDYWAIGSGDKFALGALEMDADAVRAVQIGCKLDPWSEEPIETLTLLNPAPARKTRKSHA